MEARREINPTLARRELALYFRRLREQRGYSLDQLSQQLGVAQSQASRLDAGARGLRLEDVQALSAWYGLADGEKQRLLALAEEARRRAWWQQIDLDDSYRTLIGLEQAAESISEFCNMVVPGLLQTARYASAAAEIGELRSAKTEQAVEVRMRRQKILLGPRSPELSVVIDEAVLARGAGGDDVMLEQLQHLLDFAKRPRVTIQVIGFEEGMYPTGSSQFILLDMGVRLPPVYYREDQLNRTDSSAEDDIRKARSLWRLLQSRALDPQRSMERISRYRDGLT